jgi:hypothetical protein
MASERRAAAASRVMSEVVMTVSLIELKGPKRKAPLGPPRGHGLQLIESGSSRARPPGPGEDPRGSQIA